MGINQLLIDNRNSGLQSQRTILGRCS